MTKRIRLQDQNGDDLVVQQGESFNFLATFEDVSDPPEQLTADDILTIKLTLFAGTTAINGRVNGNIKNDNGGTLSSEGELTLKLDPADQVILDESLAVGECEEHVARIEWTWNDGHSRTGLAEFLFEVEKLADIAGTSSSGT